MSMFRRNKPIIAPREYNSWEPAAIAAEHAADTAAPKPGRRSRNSAGHLAAAVAALDAAKARDAQ
jgi:hypothetical protein